MPDHGHSKVCAWLVAFLSFTVLLALSYIQHLHTQLESHQHAKWEVTSYADEIPLDDQGVSWNAPGTPVPLEVLSLPHIEEWDREQQRFVEVEGARDD